MRSDADYWPVTGVTVDGIFGNIFVGASFATSRTMLIVQCTRRESVAAVGLSHR